MVRVESYDTQPRDSLPRDEDPVRDPLNALFRLMVLQHRTSQPRATEDEYRAWSARARERAVSASTRELLIDVAGNPASFTVAADGPLRAAVPTHADLGLIVLAIGEQPSRLRLVTVDPEDYLEGTLALARERGQAAS
jgi:hypothetical protein